MKENSVFTPRDPIFREDAFQKISNGAILEADERMTVQGTIQKSTIALLLLSISALFAWTRMGSYSPQVLQGKIFLFLILATVVYFVAVFSPKTSHITVPLYALLEGFVLGSTSWLLEHRWPGTVAQAIVATIGVLAAMLFLYRSGIIKPNQKLYTVLFASLMAICLVYFADIIMSFFGSSLGFIHGSSPLSIGFSVFVCVIASLYLIFDFEFIREQSAQGAPKKMEWIAALGLLVTLVWLYLEILRLLSKLRSND